MRSVYLSWEHSPLGERDCAGRKGKGDPLLGEKRIGKRLREPVEKAG